jgi:hypothetical protein
VKTGEGGKGILSHVERIAQWLTKVWPTRGTVRVQISRQQCQEGWHERQPQREESGKAPQAGFGPDGTGGAQLSTGQ